jgi:hypothetical protein
MTNPDSHKFEVRIQTEAERRITPLIGALTASVHDIAERMHINMGDLVLILPLAEWADLDLPNRPAMVLGCRIVLADVPAPLIAMPVRSAVRFDRELGRRPE